MSGFVTLLYLAGLPMAENITDRAWIDLDVQSIRLRVDDLEVPNFGVLGWNWSRVGA